MNNSVYHHKYKQARFQAIGSLVCALFFIYMLTEPAPNPVTTVLLWLMLGTSTFVSIFNFNVWNDNKGWANDYDEIVKQTDQQEKDLFASTPPTRTKEEFDAFIDKLGKEFDVLRDNRIDKKGGDDE